jgi:hypothetical protein
MKPFNLEAAKRGEPIITRNGGMVTEFHHFKTEGSKKPCIAIIDGMPHWFGKDGVWIDDEDSAEDLFMAPKKRTVHVQVYGKEGDSDFPGLKAYAFENAEDAKENIRMTGWPVLGTFAIEIAE